MPGNCLCRPVLKKFSFQPRNLEPPTVAGPNAPGIIALFIFSLHQTYIGCEELVESKI